MLFRSFPALPGTWRLEASQLRFLQFRLRLLLTFSFPPTAYAAADPPGHWSNHTEEEATWETEDYLNKNYPEFLPKGVGT